MGNTYGATSRRKMLDILAKDPEAIFLDPYGQEIPHEIIFGGIVVNEDDEEFFEDDYEE
ncbi:Hypothetical protein DEACI_2879 [Acididesulfobacillus acetoxydans]|uniref:Uncharacterized protein n=1 Tax=Acididesulfobacillus acetoxydans TaxID=1561005 RepID=A0A8S0XC96_9FIRM|nr:hypothetical protein [Acididesulfobacillus acetoxydans]CAA7602206.1 Hypothetical protein DEACI_2879 [Acididesulfobacillus acetoxydans]CEJ07576.1 Hypothetical protein DEACI_2042 [Acididesulfobacillus acetoxydans]